MDRQLFWDSKQRGRDRCPWTPSFRQRICCELLNRADISVLVYDELRKDVAAMAKEACPDVEYLVSMQAKEDAQGQLSLGRLLADHKGGFSCDLDPDRMCAILFTSGTTGKSKGVMLSHRNLADNASCLNMKIPAGTVTMTLLPIHHAYCFTMDILKGIYIGVVICINDSIMHVSKNMKLFRPQLILLVPMVIESIYHEAEGVRRDPAQEDGGKGRLWRKLKDHLQRRGIPCA